MNEQPISRPENNNQDQLTVEAAYTQAVEHFNFARYPEAEHLGNAIIQAVPNHVDAINLLGVIAQKVDRHDLAVPQFQRAIAIAPERIFLFGNLGISLNQLGRTKEAVVILQQALEKEPGNSQIANLLRDISLNAQSAKDRQNEAEKIFQAGVLHHQAGHLAEAIACFRKTLTILPNNGAVLNNLGVALYANGELKAATSFLERAIAQKPDNAEAYYNLGNVLSDQQQLAAAATAYQQAIAIKPDYAKAFSNLGAVCKDQGKLDTAIANLEMALRIDPDHLEALITLGVTLKSKGRLEEAVANLNRAVTINPNHAEAHCNLGAILTDLGQLDQAGKSLQKAILLKENHAEAYNNLAVVLKVQGQLQPAEENLKKAIACRPDFPEAYFNLSITKKFTDTSEINTMADLLSRTVSADNKIFLNFALGKALADIKRDNEAFAYFLEGNRLKRKTINFNLADESKTFDRLKNFFSEDFFAARKNFGSSDKTPIFILGMPRSGSTLIEQILASHPDVHGAGELYFIQQTLIQTLSSDLINSIPATVAKLTADSASRLGEKYIEKIRNIEPDARFIIDKMPGNFLYIGMIRLMLPNAKIIHSVRGAEDTCLSIFRTNFTRVPNYAYDLTELAHYYRLYHDLMTHWQKLFPENIYNANYENLIENQEEETKKLLQFCQLDWHEECLDFHKTVRDVKTASNYQVRQPIYRSSIKGWQRFAKQLQPLVDGLGDLRS